MDYCPCCEINEIQIITNYEDDDGLCLECFHHKIGS